MKNIMFRYHNVFIRPLLAVFCLVFLLAYSQQDPQITHNMFNRFMYNPAVAGAYPEFHATLLHRNQWVGVDGAPTTSNLNAYAYLSQIQGGVGINVINDKAGMFSAKTVTASYAYQTMLGQKHRLGMGLSFGFMQYGYDGTWVTPDNTADQFCQMLTHPKVYRTLVLACTYRTLIITLVFLLHILFPWKSILMVLRFIIRQDIIIYLVDMIMI